LNDAKQVSKERVCWIGFVVPLITIRPARQKTDCAQFAQLILDRAQGKPAEIHQFTHVMLLGRSAEEQAQHCSAHLWEQHIEHWHVVFHDGSC
jgi:hypothetical protein